MDLLTGRRPGGLVGICQNYSRESRRIRVCNVKTPVSTREIHGISPDLDRPDFFTGVGEGILTVLC